MSSLVRRIALSIAVVSFAGAGCATVEPWERGTLMKACMQTGDPLQQAMDIHIQRTREAIAGGTSGGGASCGCN